MNVQKYQNIKIFDRIVTNFFLHIERRLSLAEKITLRGRALRVTKERTESSVPALGLESGREPAFYLKTLTSSREMSGNLLFGQELRAGGKPSTCFPPDGLVELLSVFLNH